MWSYKKDGIRNKYKRENQGISFKMIWPQYKEDQRPPPCTMAGRVTRPMVWLVCLQETCYKGWVNVKSEIR